MNQMEDARNSVKMGGIKKNSIPPGFTSRTAFILKRTTSGEDTENRAPLKNPSVLIASSSHQDCSIEDNLAETNLQIKHRAWIVHDQLDHHEKGPDDKPNYENVAIPSERCLPKGLIWGCSSCSDCLKVPAQWDPECAHYIKLQEAPVFQPTDEEFNDTLKYIESIYQQVKPYGLCRIVPPPSWQPPCFFGEDTAWEGVNFSTRVQNITDFGNCTKRKRLAFSNVQESKRRKISKLYSKNNSANGDSVNFEAHWSQQAEMFQFGPHLTYESFKKNADCFKERYFKKKNEVVIPRASQTTCHEQWEPSEEDIEGEYWRILENPTAEIEVLCCPNLDIESLRKRALQSMEAETSNSIGYQDLSWDLSNLCTLPGSLLSYENSDYVGDQDPSLRIGMCFSTLPWELAEQHQYSLCCLYLGAPKIWYGVPGHYFHRFQAAVKKHLPANFAQNPELLYKLAIQVSPSTLQAEGIPVYRCVQRPREFVLFVPGAYHTGFDCGFNVSESVCFATLNWLPHVQSVLGLYREKQMKQLVCHEKLLFRVAQEAVKSRCNFLLRGLKTPEVIRWNEACGKGSAIAVTLKACVEEEVRKREFLCTKSQSKKMSKSFDIVGRKECSTCNSVLYLSAAFCRCGTGNYSCLKHTKNLCSCGWSEKVFLLRFDTTQLNLLVEATEGNITAAFKWFKQNMQHEPRRPAPIQPVLLSDDNSSTDNSSVPADSKVNDDPYTRDKFAERTSTMLGVPTFDTASLEADISDSSSESESHCATNGRQLGESLHGLVYLSSDDED